MRIAQIVTDPLLPMGTVGFADGADVHAWVTANIDFAATGVL
jgi:hypothetical protein